MNLSDKTTRAVGWTTGAKILQQLLQFGLSVVLMRLLGPEAFGLVWMVLVFSGFAGIFSEFGFGSALVQHPDVREEHRSSVFWMGMGMGLLLTAVFLFGASLVADFYNEPMLKPMTQWMALNFIIVAVGKVPRAMLQKEMRFDAIAKVTVISLAVSGTVAVTVAVAGGGVWSLVAQRLTEALVSSALFFRAYRWRPRFMWSRDAAGALFRYSLGLTGFNIINYWARSADNLLIGRFMGAGVLGLYSRAYSLMLLPLTQVVAVIGPVMFPALSSIQHDKPRVRRAYLRVINVLTFITFPMMLGLVLVADPFVRVVFGSAWLGVIPLIQVLGFVGLTQTLCNPCGWIYTSQGRTDWMFWWGLAGSGLLIVSIVTGILIGTVQAVAVAYLIGNLIITGPCIAIPGRLISMRLWDVWTAVRGNLSCALLMSAAVWLTGLAFPMGARPVLILVAQVIVGVLTYSILVWQTRQPALAEFLELRNRFRNRSSTGAAVQTAPLAADKP
ncbi:MAG TPA: MOP flippase family protein [Verrucomicrobiota bacterium]|nr:MOP flippase family protein [Verrucomicrobiota bacterium]